MRPARFLLAGPLIAASLATSGLAMGDWPTARHDARRTGVSTTGSDIVQPAAYWRARLGGTPDQIYLGDVNQDGKQDVLYLSSGELFLASVDGTTLWRTGGHGYSTLVGVADLNKDGQLDVVVASSTGVTVVGGTAGTIEWVEPNELGTPAAFRIADLNGDGTPDLWLDSCGCCAIENGSPGVIYSFASGFGAPAKLGLPPARPHCGASSNAVGDFIGDGKQEMISTAGTSATLFRADGSVVATTGPILPDHSCLATCQTADIDGVPGQDLVCFTNTVYGGTGERGLFALAYRPMPSPSLSLLWNVQASAASDGDAQSAASYVSDLDGDGKPEAFVSGRTNGVYTASVLDAATGTVLVTAPGIATGDIASGTPGKRLLLVSNQTSVTAMAFARNPPALTPVWTLMGAPAAQADWTRAPTTGPTQALTAPDLDGDGVPDLVLSTTTEPTVLLGYASAKPKPTMLGQYALGPGIGVAALGVSQASVPGATLFVGRNDGFVALLNQSLTPTNLGHEGTATLPGMFVGGYYTGGGAGNGYGQAPISARLRASDTADALLVVDSRGDLLRIDAKGASNTAPAQPTWRLQDSRGAAVRVTQGGSATIGAFRRRHPLTVPPVWVLAAVDPDGQEQASITLANPPIWDVVPGDFSGDGSTSFAAMDVHGSDAEVTVMTSKGQQGWQQTLPFTAGTAPLAVADWNGDGADDVIAAFNLAQVYSGKSGGKIAVGADALNYFMPIVTQLEGGAQLDLLLQGGYDPVRALDGKLGTLWTAAGPTQPYPYGAVAACPSGKVLVEGSVSTSAQLTFTTASGANAGSTTSIVLASGAVFPDVMSATQANATLGQLTDVAISTNLDGTNSGPTAIVGSTDGYLYGVDACTAKLRWATGFGAYVGSPILADLDGTGKDQIFVSVADGYLYALKNQILPPPSFVYDTNPTCGVTDAEAPFVETKTTLYATWGAVPGATSYEVAVVDTGGAYLTTPNWIDVGSATTVSIPNLALVDGGKYFVGVRAVSPAGKSPDKTSAGIVVDFSGEPDAGCPPAGTGGSGTGGAGGAPVAAGPGNPIYGRACTCSTPGQEGVALAPWALFALAATLMAGRRRSSDEP